MPPVIVVILLDIITRSESRDKGPAQVLLAQPEPSIHDDLGSEYISKYGLLVLRPLVEDRDEGVHSESLADLSARASVENPMIQRNVLVEKAPSSVDVGRAAVDSDPRAPDHGPSAHTDAEDPTVATPISTADVDLRSRLCLKTSNEPMRHIMA